MPLIGENNNDLRLYYHNTYCRCLVGDEMKWYGIMEPRFGPRKGVISCHLQNEKGQLIPINLKQEDIIPDTGPAKYFFHKSEALFLKRHPHRAASRSLTRDNAHFVNPLVSCVPENFYKALVYEVDDFLSVLNNKTPTHSLQDAIAFLLESFRERKSIVSVPVKNIWCLSLSLDSHYMFSLWYRLVHVGNLDKIGRYTPINTEFNQEVRDNFPHVNF